MNSSALQRQVAFLRGRALRLNAEGFLREATFLRERALILEQGTLHDEAAAQLADLVDGAANEEAAAEARRVTLMRNAARGAAVKRRKRGIRAGFAPLHFQKRKP